MSKFGLGIIGYGGIATFHTNTLIKDPRIEIRGVYDINPARMDIAAERGYPVCFSADELMDNPEIQIVLIATPNNFHHDYGIDCMRRGKHIIVEKPVTMDSAELAEMMRVATETGMVFTVHQNRRRDVDFLMIKKAIDSGEVGKPFIIESRVHGSRGVPEGWRQYKIAGGGMLLDWGVHMIDQLLTMRTEKVVSVYTHMFSIKCPEVDDYFKLHMRYADGLSAQIEVGTYNFINLPRWYVCGDAGTMQIDDWSCKGRILKAKDRVVDWEEEIIYTKAGPTKTMAPRAKETIEEIPLPLQESDYSLYYSDLIDHLEGKKPLAVRPEEAMRTTLVMEAAFKSHETGQAVQMSI